MDFFGSFLIKEFKVYYTIPKVMAEQSIWLKKSYKFYTKGILRLISLKTQAPIELVNKVTICK